MKLLNSVSLNMLTISQAGVLRITPISEPADLQSLVSCIGHRDMATLLSVKLNREKITLADKETAILCQCIGDRLPEGTTELPAGSKLRWFEIQWFQDQNHFNF